MKTTTKRVFSLFLTLVMVLGLCTVGTFATNPSITVYDADDEEVSGTYTTIDAAAAAAGVGGKIELGIGTYEFNGRQTIAVNGIRLVGHGIGQTIVTTSASYASASQTNRKALLTIAASNVTVSGISFDGGNYGRTLVPIYNNADTEFNVVRVNSGSATLDNVSIAGSTRTLLSIGTGGNSPTSASVIGQGLVCTGMDKDIDDDCTFADVSIVRGSLSLDANCVMDAYISKDGNVTTSVLDVTNCPSVYSLKYPAYTIFFYTYYTEVAASLKRFAEAYANTESATTKDKYATMLDYTNNETVLNAMITQTDTNLRDGNVTEDDLFIGNTLLDAVQYALTKDLTNTKLANWQQTLINALAYAQS